MSNSKALKRARDTLQEQLRDSDSVSDAWIEFTDLLVVATTMQSDLIWAYQLCETALNEYPEMHIGLKTQLEGFRNYYEKNY